MPLRLRLKPHERVIIGNAVVRNGDAAAALLIENQVPVLREPDILSPQAVCTPCERVYLALQLLYVDVERRAEHQETYRRLAGAVVEAAPSCGPIVIEIDQLANAGNYYQALKAGHGLRRHEREILQHVS